VSPTRAGLAVVLGGITFMGVITYGSNIFTAAITGGAVAGLTLLIGGRR
jgi:hypothetical protein